MKNREKILWAIGDIQDQYIEEAAVKIEKRSWKKWLAAAVVLILAAGPAIVSLQSEPLPMITLETERFSGEGLGFEGYFAYDFSEIKSGNPWSETLELKTLPVFKNNSDSTESTKIEFDPALKLPETYDFAQGATYEALYDAATYLQTDQADLLNMENPKISISGGDYTIANEQLYTVGFFDDSGSITDRILNYNFFNVVFYQSEVPNAINLARIYSADLSEKLGDYPIITVEEAVALLTEGHYITTVPEAFPGEAYIQKVELVYRHEGVYMPYYRIYAEVPVMAHDNGLKTYGAYYVPAVEAQYITNMPLWDGSFN